MQKRSPPIDDDQKICDPTPEARRNFGEAFERLVGVMARLRSEQGCPWDRAQDLRSLRPYVIEEAYEVVDAVTSGDLDDHREELGDLLLQVVFQAEIRREQDAFDAADVAHGIADKLVRRHPHVFGEDRAADPGDALKRWEAVKAKEKEAKSAKIAKDANEADAKDAKDAATGKAGKDAPRSALAGVPSELPALLRAQRVSEKASGVGFDWKDLSGPLAKVDEELGELRSAIASKERAAIEHELGDVLFSLVNVARFLDLSAEDALRETTARFSRRFEWVEAALRARGTSVHEASFETLEAEWNEAKKRAS
ncbi:MAG: nucleoside triphosphate pyrophosphohydrolase [Deltaproteobacteria bacterium]|nr:nucleoside triphosphate pyrophosphohydrolase [Deltaproteobacteria bacterium]